MLRSAYIGDQYTIQSIDYLRGVLDVHAKLNQPISTLSYHYELIELGSDPNTESLLRKACEEFQDVAFSLQPITADSFKEGLKSWLFEEGRFQWFYDRQDSYVEQLCEDFKTLLGFNDIFKVEGIVDHYTFGIDFDYFVLKGDSCYLLYFLYMD